MPGAPGPQGPKGPSGYDGHPGRPGAKVMCGWLALIETASCDGLRESVGTDILCEY